MPVDSAPAAPTATNDLLESSPTVGRLSDNGRQALSDGFAELDAALKRISNRTGLAPVQIVKRWDATKTRVTNSWNIYQGYFEERREEEISRLRPEERPACEDLRCVQSSESQLINLLLAGAIPDKSTVSACYERFKEAKPDLFDDILRSWYRLRLMADKGEMSVAKRAREFKKHVDNIDGVVSGMLLPDHCTQT